MPAYDYTCRDCGKPFEIRMSISEYSEGVTPECPSCRSTDTARSFTVVNVMTGSSGRGGSAASCGPTGFG